MTFGGACDCTHNSSYYLVPQHASGDGSINLTDQDLYQTSSLPA